MVETATEPLEHVPAPQVPKRVGRQVLRFRLPGTWHMIDLIDPEVANTDARKMAEELLGISDEAAPARILLRRRLADAADASAAGNGRALFIATELSPGVPLPATITLFEPEHLRMSPAIGTQPQEVLRVFKEGLEQLATPGIEDAQLVEGENFLALRIHRIDERQWEETPWNGEGSDPAQSPETAWAWSEEMRQEASQATMRDILVDYWVTVPETKALVLVTAASSLGDMPHAMLGFFDALISAAYFVESEAEEPASVAD